MKFLLSLLAILATVAGDRALVRIGVSKTTIPSPVTTETTSTTTPKNTTETPRTTTETIKANSSTITSSSSTTTTISPLLGNATQAPGAEEKNQTTNATEVLMKIPRRIRLHQEEGYYCKCDLKINVCDVDCCCDIDCTGEMLSLFDCHESYISTEDYHVLHGLPSCRVSSSIFCVLRNNLHRYDYEEFDENLLAEKIHRWSDVLTDPPAESHVKIYRLNEPIRIFTESGDIELKIPMSVTAGSVCHIEESVKFLNNIHRSCSKSMNSSMEFLRKFSNIKVLPRPTISCENSRNSCLSFELFRCKAANSQDCELFNATESSDSFPFDLTLKFAHNFTQVLRVEVLALERETIEESYQQIIEVIFATVNESQSHRVSGNIGYLRGEPVIYTHIRSVNISDEKQEPLIEYFHPNRTSRDEDFHMILSGSSMGRCSLKNPSWETINFGENQMRTCEIHLLDTLNITQETNFTEICQDFHQKILRHLFTIANATEDLSGEEIFVSEFGNPRNDTSNWIQIQMIGVEASTVEGFFDATDNTVTCRNMLIRVKHEYQYGCLEVAGNRHQALIERALIDFSPRVDLQFKINEDFRVPIFQYISFIDLTHRIRNSASSHTLLLALLLPLGRIFI